MDNSTYSFLQKDALSALKEHRLGDALNVIGGITQSLNSWQLCSKHETLSESYFLMLKYMAEGIDDRERKKLYMQFIRESYELLDSCFQEQYKNSDLAYYQTRRQNKGALKDLFATLEKNIQQQMHILYQKESELYINEKERLQHEKYKLLDILFLTIWTSSGWSKSEAEDFSDMFSSLFLTDLERAHIVSAMTLAVFEFFDVAKMVSLIRIYRECKSESVKQRALIGFILATLLHCEKVSLYPDLMTNLSLLSGDSNYRQDLISLQIQLLLTMETRNIQKKMQDDIIPNIIKNPHFKLSKFGFKDVDEENLKNESNPEWKTFDEKTQYIEQQLGKLAEMQAEGADVYMGTFTYLKRYPFFRQIPNWFLPFTTEHSDIASLFKPAQYSSSLLQAFVESDTLCDSDKYSFCLMASQIPVSQQTMLQQMVDNMQISEEQFIDRVKKSRNSSDSRTVQRLYVQDLYRYFKLCPVKGFAEDPFKKNQLFVDYLPFKNLCSDVLYLETIADLAFKQTYYSLALHLFELLESCIPLTAEHWQKIGFCYQKMQQYEKAVSAYQKANLIKADSRWVLNHLAQCHYSAAQYERALYYYLQVEQMDQKHIQTLYNCGKSLLQLKRYKEALMYFRKIEFLSERDQQAPRAVAWCLFLTKDIQKAESYYLRILATSPQVEDYINAAHTAWVNNDIPLAIKRYLTALDSVDTAVGFYDHLSKDASELALYGITLDDIRIIADVLVKVKESRKRRCN